MCIVIYSRQTGIAALGMVPANVVPPAWLQQSALMSGPCRPACTPTQSLKYREGRMVPASPLWARVYHSYLPGIK
jgi:hypothetical protein